MDISIVIPTYNERENIEELVKRLYNVLKKYNFEIIFVDDNSTDGTIDKIKEMINNYKNIKLFVRKRKMGINSAFIYGYKKSSGKYIILMDADLQHPPEIIPIMINYLERGYDIVVASRFLKESKIIGLSTFRKFSSFLACKLVNFLISKIKISDPLSGFFSIRREILDKVIDKIKFKRGFKILIEILANSEKIKVKEIPFTFGIRKYGKSKINKIVLIEFIKQITYYSWLKRIIKFYIVSLTGIVVNLLSLYFLNSLGFPHFISSAIAIEFSIINNFLLNNYWTFKDKKGKKFSKKFIEYHIVTLSSTSLQYILSNLLYYFALRDSILSQLIAIFFAAIINLIGSFKIVWKE